MADHDKIFAKFPGNNDGGTNPNEYFLIDIFTIEAIGQTDDPVAAIIFCPKRFYRATVTQELLDELGMPDCATLCNQIIANTATAAAGFPISEDEHPTGAATFHGDPDMPL